MFGRKGKVTITDAGFIVTSDVDIIDNRTKREVFSYYPTAEQARNIEPEIREDLVEESVKATLEEVVCSSKKGLFAASVDYTPFMDKLCNTAERKSVIDRLRSLGYTYYNGVISW